MRYAQVFCSFDCYAEYFSISLGYPGDGIESYCQNCGTELDPSFNERKEEN